MGLSHILDLDENGAVATTAIPNDRKTNLSRARHSGNSSRLSPRPGVGPQRGFRLSFASHLRKRPACLEMAIFLAFLNILLAIDVLFSANHGDLLFHSPPCFSFSAVTSLLSTAPDQTEPFANPWLALPHFISVYRCYYGIASCADVGFI